MVVDDAPDTTDDKQRVLDLDLQKLVNGLWQVGAEAISINGQRLTSLSAIRDAGSSITVNFVVPARALHRARPIGDQQRRWAHACSTRRAGRPG